MQQAIEHIVDVRTPASVGRELIDSIREDKHLPALGSAVAQVVRMASSGDEAVGELARFILSDVALTQKILRLANTATCRGSTTTPVTTISRAIFLLGFDMIITSATAMLLVERLSDRRHASLVRKELAESLYASAIARLLSRRAFFKDAEEAAVAALFTNVGRILVASHDHISYQEIATLQEKQKLSASQSALHVIGCSFDALAATVLREWQIPESTIGAALASIPGKPRPVRTRQDWLQQAVQFSTEVSSISALEPAMQAEATSRLLARFGDNLHVDAGQLSEWMARAEQETRELMMQMEPVMEQPSQGQGHADATASLLHEMSLGPAPGDAIRITSRFPSGKPVNARDLLLAGVQDITQMMSSGQAKASDLMLTVLETLCHSMGFRFAAACLLDASTGTYRARLTIGDDHAAKRQGMDFPSGSGHDLFHLSLENDVDLLIADAHEPKIRALLPAWHLKTFADARSFMVLPLVVQRRKIGLFYADRVVPAPEGVPPDETSLIKTLKGQVLTALQSRH